jgi:16S rRNA (cytidine1402-2'-O)-methyltransferase
MDKKNTEKQPVIAKSRGCLNILGTAIGNPEDHPPRTLKLAKNTDILICEEDRPARQLLKAAGIHRSYLKYSEHQQLDVLESALVALQTGKSVSILTDQGMPAISDPGRDLSELAFKAGADIRVIPGPSSLTAAIAACPFDCSRFNFEGFLPRIAAERQKHIEIIAQSNRPSVMMETPYRREAFCEALGTSLPERQRVFFAIDISGEHENYLVVTAKELKLNGAPWQDKLNFVAIVEPLPKQLSSSGNRVKSASRPIYKKRTDDKYRNKPAKAPKK